MGYEKGVLREQLFLFCSTLEDCIASDNPVRLVNAFVEYLDLVRLGFTHAQPAATGRPPFDPADMLKLYVYGYLNRLRSSRCLEKETQRNIEMKWLLRGITPDFKTIADFRRDNAGILKKVFSTFVAFLRGEDLIGGIVSIDGSKFRAVNAAKNNTTENKLKKGIAKDEKKIQEYLKVLEENDRSESSDPSLTPEKVQEKLTLLRQRTTHRKETLQHLQQAGQTQLSTVDPESRLMKDKQGFAVCYNVQTAVESENKFIIDYEVTNEPNDKNMLATMAIGSQEVLGVTSLDVVADAGYHNSREIARCIEHGITPYVPEEDVKSRHKKQHVGFERDDFVFDAESNRFMCPCGYPLMLSSSSEKDGKVLLKYRCSAFRTCGSCSLCSPGGRAREVCRYEHDEHLIAHRKRMEAHPEMMKQRRELSEHPFGTVKRPMNMGYMLLKGLRKTTGEMALTFLAYNLKRAITVKGVEALCAALQALRAPLCCVHAIAGRVSGFPPVDTTSGIAAESGSRLLVTGIFLLIQVYATRKAKTLSSTLGSHKMVKF